MEVCNKTSENVSSRLLKAVILPRTAVSGLICSLPICIHEAQSALQVLLGSYVGASDKAKAEEETAQPHVSPGRVRGSRAGDSALLEF